VADLERSALVDADDVTVTVDGGAVTLTGSVPTWSARAAAYDAARHTAGVTSIHDALAIAA
jgi:osmotically-inducible protein OsmY